ncbi:two pore domain potassium channel family protein [Roseovarius sp. LXJ103]|uniref:ion channel n=1 Tax=Roseovarius carneus TaxID=2853164 RepID=UPI000D609386|nr:ion channel [Roseovarius carneus]MBZ8117398.1 two pore domain potassium channel family protein [Roseovarius carneus]PWE36787.1 Ion transport 2 [Pelagicola sp. LXJ1103]
MTLSLQITLGTSLLLICAVLHISALVIGLPLLQALANRLKTARKKYRGTALLVFGVLVIVVAHTLQIWIWAAAIFATGAFPDFATSFYFPTTTYTTLGYGDMVLTEGWRSFGTFAAITGLLTFGISTAFLINLIGRIMPALTDHKH